MAQLISERVMVQRDPEGVLKSFEWQGHVYEVEETLSDYRHVDFQSRWWLRRHRRRLIVRTKENRYFELYAQRPGEWVLYRELDDPFGQ